MKRLVNLAAISMALVAVGNNAAFAESTEQKIIRLEKEDYEATIAKDYRKMRTLAADDWVQQDDSDERITRELMISRLKSGEFIPESGTFGPMSVDVIGDVAIVMGSVDERFTFAGKQRNLHSNFLDVWTKRHGKWVSIRTQMASRDSTQ